MWSDGLPAAQKSFIPTGVSNSEALLRMNFLAQAAALAATRLPVSEGVELGRFYNKTLRDVSQKLVIRLYAFVLAE